MNRAVRGLLAVFAGAALALGIGIAAPVAADADVSSDCYVQLDAPSKVTIDRRYKDVRVYVIDSCGIADYASFDLYGPDGWDDVFIFDGNDVDHWNVYNWQTPGRYTTRLSGAWHANDNDLGFEATTTTVKLGTKADVSTKRSGKMVTIAVSAKTYSPSRDSNVAWNATSAKIQYKSGSTWKTLKTVRLKSGKASYSYQVSSKRSYRFLVGETSNRWGSTSNTSTR
jgi:hypothetical protein